MPPQLRLIENEDSKEQALWNPETQSVFDPKDSKVVIHESGQQALFDPTSQSIIAYLPSSVGQTPTSVVTQEHPVKYGGSKKEILPEVQPPSALQRLAMGPVGTVVEKGLEVIAKPAQLANEYLAKPLTPFPELLKPETYMQEEGAVFPESERRKMEAISQPLPEIMTKPVIAAVDLVRKASPEAAKVIEDTMANYPALQKYGPIPKMSDFAMKIREATKGKIPEIQSVEELKATPPRNFIEEAKARRAARESEPAFVETLKEEPAPVAEATPPVAEAPKIRELRPEEPIEDIRPVERAEAEGIVKPRVEPTEAWMQGVLAETPQRETPTTALRTKARQTEKLTDLEKATIPETQMELAGQDKPIPSKGPLTPEEIAAADEMRQILGGKKRTRRPRLEDEEVAASTFIQRQGGMNIPAKLKEEFGAWNRYHNPKGLGVDEMAEALHEAGIIPEPTINSMLEAKGTGRRTAGGFEKQQMAGYVQDKINTITETPAELQYKGKTYTEAIKEKGGIRLKDDVDVVLKKDADILKVEEKIPFDVPFEESSLSQADLAAQKLFGTRGGAPGEPSDIPPPKKLTPLEKEMGHPVTETTFEGIPKGVTGSRLETGTTKLITEAGIEAFKSLGKELEPDIPVTIQLARAMQRGELDLRGLERILESKGVSREQFIESFITTASNAGRQLSQLAKVVKSLKNADAAFGEIGKRLPLYTSILEAGKTFIEKGKLSVAEGTQLGRDVIDSIRLNLFSVTSFSLDMIGNATEIGAQIAGGVGKDLVQVAKGHVNFPSIQAVIRTIKDRPRVAGVEKGLELTAIGEKLRGGFQKGPGTFTLRSNAASKGLDYLVGSPLYLKGVMDTGAKRFSAAISIWQDAIMSANLKGLKGTERQKFYEQFWEDPPKSVIQKAINEGNKAGFNRTLSKIEEKYASSTTVKLLVDTFGRWPWQFTRWGAEMVGYNPELFKAIRQGKASAEDIAGYLTKTASGWGGLYLIDRALYDHVDFNSMEYVHADGDRTRLSSREPLASALWLLAVIKGDVEKAKGGFKFASVPGAQLLGEQGTPGLLGGIIKQAQAAISRKGVDPRGLSRELTGFLNRLIPGQAILSAIESVFDPTLREGIGANIPGISSLKPAAINPATGKPLISLQEIPGTGIEFPQIGGVPIPGATRKLDPVTKILSKFGLLVYRGPRQPIAGVPPGEAPTEVRREWLEAFGKRREKTLSPLIPRIEEAERLHPKEMLQGGRLYEAWRKRIQFYDSIAAKRATAEVNAKRGTRKKLPRQPTLRELRRPNAEAAP